MQDGALDACMLRRTYPATTPVTMETTGAQLTDTILNLTLEIINLLTGEECSVITRSGECLAGSRHPPVSRKSHKSRVSPASEPRRQRNHEQKILEVANKIIELLTGEVPVRCQDVAVYLSMEEREYLEGHCDWYRAAMIDDRPPLTAQGTSNFPKEHSFSAQYFSLPQPAISPPVNHSLYSIDPEKEEPPSSEEEGHSGISTIQTQHLPTYVKEEPFSCMEEDLPCANLYLDAVDGHYTAIQIKVEPGDLSDTDTYVADSDLQYGSIHRMEEPTLCGGGIEDVDCYVLMTPPRYASEVNDSSARYKNTPKNSDRPINAAVAEDGSPVICSECGQCFSSNATLILHQMSHRSKTVYSCPQCGMCFSNNTYLIAHLDAHPDVKVFACCHCGKRFATKADCAKHEKGHALRKPYICTVCGKIFSNNSNRVRHQKIHTGEKPFSCSECGKSFRRRTHLTIHSRVHTGERPFTCQECGKCFSCSAHLTAHRRIHKREAIYLL